jgi:arsenate reductase
VELGARPGGGDLALRNVLFLCTGNSARSILAEALLNRRGRGRVRAFSAGSHPKGAVHPFAVRVLEEEGLPTEGLRSKSWDEFAGAGAPAMDFVFTVCGQAAREVCPVWPGRPVAAHWIVDDPAAVEGGQEARMAAFRRAFRELEARIDRFLALPIDSLDPGALRQRLEEIGASAPGS